ncbi:hypothetical protein RHS01_04571 [Rhizoctonia solani]|uniref:Uncharacterized protein n=1 Tax=Rhizoctonia solani TaxID=456999 RepID=A0A8H7M606_9AGAM|nr:hypothetical protein RHS01_04571 [Rhizoctonia solani]
MRLDTSFLVGVWLEALVYGSVYVAAFAVCLRLFRTHAPVVGRALPIWLGALFVLATAHCALSLSAMLDAFVRVIYTGPVASPPAPTFSPAPSGVPRPPPQQMPYQYRDATRYIGNRALPTNLAGLGVYAGIVLLSDLCSCIASSSSTATDSFGLISIIIVVKYAHIDLTVNYETLQKQLDALNLWVPPVYAISFLANLSITALMMVKTSFGAPRLNNNSLPAFATRRRHTHRTTLSADDGYVFDIDERTARWALFAGLVESGALAPVFMLAALILYVAQDAQETLLVPMLAPLAALIPTLQIIQLQLGLDSDARNRPVSKAWSEFDEHGSGQGRSPYLVPAPGTMIVPRTKTRRREWWMREEYVGLAGRTSGSGSGSGAGSGSGSGSGFGSGSGSGRGSHAHSNSQSSGRTEPFVMLQMRELTGSGERAAGENETKARNADGDEDVWERIKLDDSKPFIPEPNPVPVPFRRPCPGSRKAQEHTPKKQHFQRHDLQTRPDRCRLSPHDCQPPEHDHCPRPPNFTINAETGVTAQSGGGGVGSAGCVSERPGARAEHVPSGRAREAVSPSPSVTTSSSPSGATIFVRASTARISTSHLMSLPSTTPTSPASGFTSLNPIRQVGIRLDTMASPSRIIRNRCTSLPIRTHNRRDRDRDRARRSAPRSPDRSLPTSEPETTLPRWTPMPGAPRIVGLDTFFPPSRPGRHGDVVDVERDVSPAPGLKRDYTLAREKC